MIPQTAELLQDIEFITYGDTTYKMNIDKNRVIGITEDSIESVKQMVYKILNTERYEYLIYSWQFGIELKDLFGMPINWVCSELESRIKDALSTDERITDVDTFEFDTSTRNVLTCTFFVHTKYGTFSEGVTIDV